MKKMLSDLVNAVCRIFGDNLISVILYGSVARNEANEDSDVDIALLVHRDDEVMHDRMMDVLVEFDLEYDKMISPSLIEKEQFDKWKSVLPYY